MACKNRGKSNHVPTLKAGRPVMIGGGEERIDQAPLIIETTSDGLFLKPIILVEDGIAKTTKYRLRRTRKGMLRLE